MSSGHKCSLLPLAMAPGGDPATHKLRRPGFDHWARRRVWVADQQDPRGFLSLSPMTVIK